MARARFTPCDKEIARSVVTSRLLGHGQMGAEERKEYRSNRALPMRLSMTRLQFPVGQFTLEEYCASLPCFYSQGRIRLVYGCLFVALGELRQRACVVKMAGMSAGLRLTGLDDFITPSQACIKPVEAPSNGKAASVFVSKWQ